MSWFSDAAKSVVDSVGKPLGIDTTSIKNNIPSSGSALNDAFKMSLVGMYTDGGYVSQSLGWSGTGGNNTNASALAAIPASGTAGAPTVAESAAYATSGPRSHGTAVGYGGASSAMQSGTYAMSGAMPDAPAWKQVIGAVMEWMYDHQVATGLTALGIGVYWGYRNMKKGPGYSM